MEIMKGLRMNNILQIAGYPGMTDLYEQWPDRLPRR
jgi:hypothetical protein